MKRIVKNRGKVFILAIAFCLLFQSTIGIVAASSEPLEEQTQKYTVTYIYNGNEVAVQEYELNETVTVAEPDDFEVGDGHFRYWEINGSVDPDDPHHHPGDAFKIKENITLTYHAERGWGSCIHVNIVGDKLNLHYIDENGTKIADSYSEDNDSIDSLMDEGDTDKAAFYTAVPLRIQEIEGYTYSQEYYYVMYGTGRTVTGLTGGTINLRDGDGVNLDEVNDDNCTEYDVYLKYTKIPTPTETPIPEKYQITYDANEGTGTVTDDKEYALDETVTVLDGTDLSRDGYEFTGWNTQADGNGTSYKVNDTFKITKNETLYAQWEEIEVIDNVGLTMTYIANGGKGTVKDENEYAPNDTVTVLSGKDLSKDGHTFKGWNTKEDGTGTSYKVDGTFVITKNETVYAQWEKNSVQNRANSTYRTSGGKTGTTTSVKTGDQSVVSVYVAAVLLSVLIAAFAVYRRKKAFK